MIAFQDALNFVLGQEGGWKFTEDSNDPGGMTYGGMTYNTLTVYLRNLIPAEYPSPESFKELAAQNNYQLQVKVEAAYKALFWDKLELDNARWDNWPINAVYSAAVNLGAICCIEIVQTMCGVSVDGLLGNETRDAVDRFNSRKAKELAPLFKQHWRLYYAGICVANTLAWVKYAADQKVKPATVRIKYLRGWLNRVEAC